MCILKKVSFYKLMLALSLLCLLAVLIFLFTGHAGRYVVRLVPEFPWLGAEFELEAV